LNLGFSFQIFDETGNGLVSFRELMVGFSILCKGTPDEKLDFVFKLYEEAGYVEKSHVMFLLDQVYKTIGPLFFEKNQQVSPQTNYPSDKKSELFQTFEDTFAAIDKDNDGKLTKEEFKSFVKLHPQIIECFQRPPKKKQNPMVNEERQIEFHSPPSKQSHHANNTTFETKNNGETISKFKRMS